MRDAGDVMHVGIAIPRWWGKRYPHSRRMHNSQSCVSGKRPIATAHWGQIYWPNIQKWLACEPYSMLYPGYKMITDSYGHRQILWNHTPNIAFAINIWFIFVAHNLCPTHIGNVTLNLRTDFHMHTVAWPLVAYIFSVCDLNIIPQTLMQTENWWRRHNPDEWRPWHIVPQEYRQPSLYMYNIYKIYMYNIYIYIHIKS